MAENLSPLFSYLETKPRLETVTRSVLSAGAFEYWMSSGAEFQKLTPLVSFKDGDGDWYVKPAKAVEAVGYHRFLFQKY